MENLEGLFVIIYIKELEFKVEHQGDNATFLSLDVTMKEGTFI